MPPCRSCSTEPKQVRMVAVRLWGADQGRLKHSCRKRLRSLPYRHKAGMRVRNAGREYLAVLYATAATVFGDFEVVLPPILNYVLCGTSIFSTEQVRYRFWYCFSGHDKRMFFWIELDIKEGINKVVFIDRLTRVFFLLISVSSTDWKILPAYKNKKTNHFTDWLNFGGQLQPFFL